MTRCAQIISSGRYVPQKMLPNAYFDEILGREVDEWLVENVDIKERHVMGPDETTSDRLHPMALDDALQQGVGPQPGDNVLFIASGGISMACTVWRWTAGQNHDRESR